MEILTQDDAQPASPIAEFARDQVFLPKARRIRLPISMLAKPGAL
jgi:hypothetical protein